MMLTLTHQHWGGCGCIRVSFILQMIVGMVFIDETGNLTKPTEQETNKVKKTTTTQPKLQEILKKYEERFQGIGKAKKMDKTSKFIYQ